MNKIYPKRLVTGGGPIPPAVTIVSATFDQNPAAIIGAGQFTPLPENQLGISQQLIDTATISTRRFVSASAPIVLAPSVTFGNLPISGKRGWQINTRNNFSAVGATPRIVETTFAMLAFSLDGVGAPNAGFQIQVFASISISGALINILGFDLLTGIGAPPVATLSLPLTLNGENKIGIYTDSVTGFIGAVVDGVDQGILQQAGVDYPFTFPTSAGFLAETRLTNAGGADPEDYKTLAMNLILQSALIDQPMPAGTLDLGDNAI